MERGEGCIFRCVEPSGTGRPIGVATMREDGTLSLALRAEGPGGLVGDAVFEIAPCGTDPGGTSYQAWVEHLGGIRPGEAREVLPWPEEPPVCRS